MVRLTRPCYHLKVRTTLLLFDIDGTLMLSGGAGMRAMKRVGAELFGEDFQWDGVQTAGSLDPVIFAEVAALNKLDAAEAEHERFREAYLVALADELDRGRQGITVMPGVCDLLASLRRRADSTGDVTLGLLTGNYGAAVTIKFDAIGFDLAWFTITAFGDDAPTRPDLTALAMRKYERHSGDPADPRRVILVGDTPRDIAAAHAHGCVAFAVATGPHSLEELRDAGADHLAEDLADPVPLIKLID